MKIKQVWDFVADEFIYGGHLLSLGAVGIVLTSAVLLRLSLMLDFLVISYLIFYFIYAYNRFRELRDDFLTNSYRVRHIEKYIEYLPIVLCLSLFVILLILSKSGNIPSLFLALLMIFSGILYTEYFKKVTKKVVGFKSVYVSFVWALLPVLLVSYDNLPLDFPLILVFLFIFLRFIVNTVFFDIKDIESDSFNGLKTLPIFLGEKNILSFLKIINLLSFFPLMYGCYKGFFPLIAVSLTVFFFYSVCYFEIFKKKQANIQKLSFIMVDGEYILWPIVILVFSRLIDYI